MIRFTDGVEIDPSGELRILRLRDGYYVVGNGMVLPCRDHAEAEATFKECSETNRPTVFAKPGPDVRLVDNG